MGTDSVRHLVERKNATGVRFFWQPSKTIRNLGLKPEALGGDLVAAKARALELNVLADEMRRTAQTGDNGPLPGSCAKLFREYQASDEFADLKERTRKDYTYYLSKIELDFGRIMVRSLTPKVLKTHYKRVRREVSITWSYHILSTWRTVLSWAVSEDWTPRNVALDVTMKAPAKRKVVWKSDQCAIYVEKARELGWESIAVMALVFDSIGQSPVDVRTLTRKAYDGRAIDVTRSKTGVGDAPIKLFPDAKRALDAYLAKQPAKLPDAPLFTNDSIGGLWSENTLQKKHRLIREAAGLPKELQLQDFRTSVQTEGGAASGTVDELRGLARHKSRDAALHYVHPDGRFVDSIQAKRLAHRNKAKNKQRKKVGIQPEKKLESSRRKSV